jgi:hypothetical protein
MKLIQRLLLLILVAATISAAQAQKVAVTIKGQVVNAENNQPIAKANVFLSGTTIGASTDASGNYTIQDSIPKGNYSLVFSHVKFNTDAQAVVINAPKVFTFNMMLTPKTSTLEEVVVVAKKSKIWQARYKKFKREFLGFSGVAVKCKILNPWVIKFSEKRDTLYASSKEEIIIENPSLGYKVYCVLKNFSNIQSLTSYKGYYRFEKLPAKNSKKQKKLDQRRLKTFNGSFRHFMCALLYERVKAEGFEIYQAKQSPEITARPQLYNVNPKNLYQQKNSETYAVIPDYLQVIYNREREESGFVQWKDRMSQNTGIVLQAPKKANPQRSWLNIAGSKIQVSDLGMVMGDVNKLRSFGYWAWERVGDMLPSDFFPEELMQAIKVSKIQTINQLKRYVQNRPQEKVYIHQDKGYYALGDTLWLSGYVVNAQTHKPSNLSKVLYVDLIDEKTQEVKQKLTLYNNQGKAKGEFVLGYNYNPGHYKLRAYTKLIADYNPEFTFNQQFEVGAYAKKTVNAKLSYQSKQDNGQEVISYEIRLLNDAKALLKKGLQLVIKTPEKTYAKQQLPTQAASITGNVLIAKGETAPYLEFEIKSKDKKDGFKTSLFAPVYGYQTRVSFLPEGGDLVQGVSNDVAFKAITPQGKGVNVKGIITDDKGKQVATFASTHLGMGKFSFVPQKGKKYQAEVTNHTGSKQTIDLPMVKEKGFVLHIDNKDDLLVVTIRGAFRKTQPFNLIGHSRGNPVYTIASELKKKKSYTVKILKNSLPAGIVHFSLFDKDFVPQCERLVFIKKKPELNIEVASNKDDYKIREKVDLSFKVNSIKKGVLPANLSVAVVDRDMMMPGQTNILSNLLLTSDLKGYVEKPDFYFKNNKPETAAALDLLMLVNGWRRFNWQQVFQDNEKVPNFASEKGFSLSGRVTNMVDKPMEKAMVTLIAPQANLMQTAETDAKGKFKFEGLLFPKNTKVLLRAFNTKGKGNLKVILDPAAPQNISEKLPNYFPLFSRNNDQMSNYLSEQAKRLEAKGLGMNQMLNAVEVSSSKYKGRRYKRMPGQLYLAPTYRLSLDEQGADVSANNNFLDYIDGRIPGLDVKYLPFEGAQRRFIVYRGSSTTSSGTINASTLSVGNNQITNLANSSERVNTNFTANKISPLLLLNGAPVTLAVLENLPIESVQTVDMLSISQARVYGANASNGVLAVYTKPNDYKDIVRKTVKGQINITLTNGFHKARQFYVPPYQKEGFSLKPDTDFRTTIYWNPDVKVGKNGEVKVSFYNADNVGTYQVIVEGVSKEGELGRKVYTYDVKGKE